MSIESELAASILNRTAMGRVPPPQALVAAWVDSVEAELGEELQPHMRRALCSRAAESFDQHAAERLGATSRRLWRAAGRAKDDDLAEALYSASGAVLAEAHRIAPSEEGLAHGGGVLLEEAEEES